jgi:hypothetical protein
MGFSIDDENDMAILLVATMKIPSSGWVAWTREPPLLRSEERRERDHSINHKLVYCQIESLEAGFHDESRL